MATLYDLTPPAIGRVVMRPEDAVFRYSPHAKGCLQAALATVLGTKPALVPDFMHGAVPGIPGEGKGAYDAMEDWLLAQRLYPLFFEWGTIGEVLAAGEHRLWILLASAPGAPDTLWGHAYVCHADRLLWCPEFGEDPPAEEIGPYPPGGSFWALNIHRYGNGA